MASPKRLQCGTKPEIKARTTMYKGIRMRSRLEADFAAFLDRAGAEWEYEPICFAGPDGQWLPDFRARVPDGQWTYLEIKPESLPDDEIDTVLEQMTVAWLTEPAVILQLVIWAFGDPLRSCSFMGFPHEDENDQDLIWWTSEGDGGLSPWPGMGQFKYFVSRAEQAPVQDAPQAIACGITPTRRWWCECGTDIDGSERYVGPDDVCVHLRALGNQPAPSGAGADMPEGAARWPSTP